MFTRALFIAVLIFVADPVLGEERFEAMHETVSRLSKAGRHFDALVRYYNTPKSDWGVTEKTAAARSAWALGLVDRSREIFDDLFSEAESSDTAHSRIVLARAIMELQESNFESARAYAERGVSELSESELRSQFWLLIGEALRGEKAMSQAETYYEKASREGSAEARGEALFLLASSQIRSGRLDDARYSLAEITTSSRFSAQAVRRLAEIDLKQKDYESVIMWIEEGREMYPSEFEDAWSSYAEVVALVALSRGAQARTALNEFKARHTELNGWYQLAEASLLASELVDYLPEEKKAGAVKKGKQQ